MPIYHLLLAVLVVAIWGCNFIFIKFSLQEISPLFLCALRFFLASFPAVFFIKRPTAPFKWVALYGLVMFALQFSLLFLGMHLGMTPGLASLLMQVQVFFSIFCAAVFLRETPTLLQIIGALVSFMGIALVAKHLDHSATLSGFLLIIAGAAAWGSGNLITKKFTNINMIALVVWGSLVACGPLFLFSLIFEGPSRIAQSFHDISWLGASSVLFIVYGSTWIGYGIWNWLLSRYPVATVSPFTLLVPVFGMLSSAFFLGEPLPSWKLAAGALVILGLCINLFGKRLLSFIFHFSKKQDVLTENN